MSGQPLLVLGDKRRRVLFTRLADNARRWRNAWAAGANDKFEAQCEAAPRGGYAEPVAAVSTSCWALELSGERVAVLLLPHVTFAWCVLEAGGLAPDVSATVDPGSMAEQLEQAVATSLFTELCALESREVPLVTRIQSAAIEAWSREARAWTAQLRSTDSGRMFTLLLDSRRVEMLSPARAVVSGNLNTRRSAVGDNHITLRAVVGEASMSVSELADLALDDVLVLDQHLSDHVTLIGHSGHAVAAGNLGRAGARRAVKVAGMPNQKN
jgi:flagellar motor switch/type III secretory pathway protein FliN